MGERNIPLVPMWTAPQGYYQGFPGAAGYPVSPPVPYWLRSWTQAQCTEHPQLAQAMRGLTGASEVTNSEEKFHVKLDVSHFTPEEIQVKTVGQKIVVDGKHEEKRDEHGSISRHFTRKYLMPKEAIPDHIACSLSSEGVLSIEVPKRQAESPEEKIIPIQTLTAK